MKYHCLIACLSLIPAVYGGDFKKEMNIAYLGSDREEKMDAYLPSEKFSRPVPAVIWIHGGGWSGGDKAQKRELNVCQTLAENGYATFSINYQLGKKPGKTQTSTDAMDTPAVAGAGESGEEQASSPWPQNFYDCKSALRYIRSEAKRFGIDPQRIAVSGGSAGGHLALLVGVTGNVPEMNTGGLYTEQSNAVSCIIDFYGVFEITTKGRERKFAGATPEETAVNVRKASPREYLTKEIPPVLVVHGDKDGVVPVTYSRNLAKRLEELGATYQYVEIPGAPHSFDLQPKERDLRPVVLEFLERYLKKTSI
jgi:acetyl esterase/lipase